MFTSGTKLVDDDGEIVVETNCVMTSSDDETIVSESLTRVVKYVYVVKCVSTVGVGLIFVDVVEGLDPIRVVTICGTTCSLEITILSCPPNKVV